MKKLSFLCSLFLALALIGRVHAGPVEDAYKAAYVAQGLAYDMEQTAGIAANNFGFRAVYLDDLLDQIAGIEEIIEEALLGSEFYDDVEWAYDALDEADLLYYEGWYWLDETGEYWDAAYYAETCAEKIAILQYIVGLYENAYDAFEESADLHDELADAFDDLCAEAEAAANDGLDFELNRMDATKLTMDIEKGLATLKFGHASTARTNATGAEQTATAHTPAPGNQAAYNTLMAEGAALLTSGDGHSTQAAQAEGGALAIAEQPVVGANVNYASATNQAADRGVRTIAAHSAFLKFGEMTPFYTSAKNHYRDAETDYEAAQAKFATALTK